MNICSLNSGIWITSSAEFVAFYIHLLSALLLHGTGICQDDTKGQDAVGRTQNRLRNSAGFQGCDIGRCNETRMIRMIKCGFSLFCACCFYLFSISFRARLFSAFQMQAFSFPHSLTAIHGAFMTASAAGRAAYA